MKRKATSAPIAKTTPKKNQVPAKKNNVAKKPVKSTIKKPVVVESDSDSDSDDYDIEAASEFNFDDDGSDDSEDERAALAEVDFENIVLGGDADDEDIDDEDDEDLEMDMEELGDALGFDVSSISDDENDEDDGDDEDDEDDEDDFDLEVEEHFDEVEEENPKKKQKTAVVESDNLDELDDETYDWKIETEDDKAHKLALSLEKDLETARLCEKLQKRKDLIRTMIKERQKVQKARRVLKRRGSCLQQKASIKPNYTGHHRFT